MRKEKFFIVTDKSLLHKSYFKFKENENLVRKHVKKFFAEHGIKAQDYYAAEDALYIVPVGNDAEKFGGVLMHALDNGLCRFKGNSKIHKNWVRELNIPVLRRPLTAIYFNSFGGGRYRSRLFDQNGILYCSFEPCDEVPEGMQEIKGSEFYRVLEEDMPEEMELEE